MKPVSREELIKDYQKVADEIGKRPTLSEYNAHGSYSQQPIYRVFESFERLKEEADFETGEKKIVDKKLIEDIRQVADEIGRSPPVEVYDEHGQYNNKTLKRRWGNWNSVLEAAGLTPTRHSEHWEDNQPEQFGKNYGSAEVECEYCGDSKEVRPSRLDYKEKFFCNFDCLGKFRSQQTGEDARAWEGGKVEIQCEWCGDVDWVKPAEVEDSRFCTQDCMIQWRSQHFTGENHPRYKGGYERYYGPNWRRQRRKARQRDNHECQICSLDREEHHEKWDCELVVHHIVRFDDFDEYEEANRLENLITLCKTCHGLVEGDRIALPDE